MKIFKTVSIYGILFIIAAVCSCSKKDIVVSETSPSYVDNGLTGTWKWVSTDGGLANNIHETPASTGKNIDLKISSDNHYCIYTNGSLSSHGTYVLENRNCIHDNSIKQVINFSDSTEQVMMIEKIDSLNLKLSDNKYDGVAILYGRN